MTAKFTSKIRPFVASSLIDNLTLEQIGEWTTATSYTEGDVVFYGNNKYIAKSSGTSGAIAPVHVSGSASDGTISWIFIEYINVSEMFKRNTFLFIGKPTEWDDEENPDAPGICDIDDYETIQNILTLLRISSANVRTAIKRYNWTTGTVYDSYSDSKDPLATSGPTVYSHPFYVFTDENHIYKCLDNNNGAQSIYKPNAVQTNSFRLSDGYVWKFMASLDADSTYFLTEAYVPVKHKLYNDGTAQWTTQTNAKKQSLSTFTILKSEGTFPGDTTVTIFGGNPTTPATAYTSVDESNELTQILVSHSAIGLGYDMSARIDAVVANTEAPGSGGTITGITVTNGVITNMTFTAGNNYSEGAIVILIDPTNTPSEEAQITVDIAENNTIADLTIVDGGGGYSADVYGYIIPGDSGAVGRAVFAPKEGHGNNIVTELAANTAIINVRLSENTDYLLTGDNYAFRQLGLITDVYEYGGTDPAYNLIYIGPSHPEYDQDDLNRIDNNKGYVLYLNDRTKVVRSGGQEEDIRVAITF